MPARKSFTRRSPAEFRTQHVAGGRDEPANLLCYEMNGAPLPEPHGYSATADCAGLVWDRQRQVAQAHRGARHPLHGPLHGAGLRHSSRRAARNGETESVETSVGRPLLKSVPAKVTRNDGQYRILGAAWGAPIARVDVQIDGGPWRAATIDRSEEAEFAWKFWSLDWPNARRRAHGHFKGGGYGGAPFSLHGAPEHREQENVLGKQRAGVAKDSHRVTILATLQRSGVNHDRTRDRGIDLNCDLKPK